MYEEWDWNDLPWPEKCLFWTTLYTAPAVMFFLHLGEFWDVIVALLHGRPDPWKPQPGVAHLLSLFWDAAMLGANLWLIFVLPSYVLIRLAYASTRVRLQGDFTPWPDRAGLGVAGIVIFVMLLFDLIVRSGLISGFGIILFAVLVVVTPLWIAFRAIDYALGGVHARSVNRAMLQARALTIYRTIEDPEYSQPNG